MTAAAYARFSSDNQREESIDAQLRAIRKYAESEDISLVASYVDYAISGSTDERAEFQRMFADARRKMFDCVIVHKLDRFVRNLRDTLNYEYELKQLGIKLISVTEPTDDTSTGFLVRGMKGVINHFYLLNLAEEVKKGLRENAYKCMTTGGRAPLGYEINKKKKYVINRLEAEAIKIIFNMYADGKSYREISTLLNKKGYKTKRGNDFAPNSLHDIISNEKYKGDYVFGKRTDKHNKHKYSAAEDRIVVEDGVPAIVEKELWARANARRRTRSGGTNKAKYNYLLSGLLECGDCGHAVVGHCVPNRQTGRQYLGYRCIGRKLRGDCSLPTISKNKIESAVINELKRLIFNDDIISVIATELHQKLNELYDTNPKEIEGFKRQLKKTEAKIKNIVKAVAEGWAAPSMKPELAQYEEEKKLIYEKLAELNEAKLKSLPTLQEVRDFVQKTKHMLDGTDEEKKYVLNIFIEKIILYPDKTLKLKTIMDLSGTGLGVPNKKASPLAVFFYSHQKNRTCPSVFLKTRGGNAVTGDSPWGYHVGADSVPKKPVTKQPAFIIHFITPPFPTMLALRGPLLFADYFFFLCSKWNRTCPSVFYMRMYPHVLIAYDSKICSIICYSISLIY